MIRVCYVLSTSEKSGGANKSLLDILRNLNRDKIKPYVLLRRHGDVEEELRDLDISYAIIPYINSVTTGNWVKDYIKRMTYRWSLPGIKKFYQLNKIDVVHNNSLPALAGMEAACNLGIPYICHIREDVEKGLGVHFLDKGKHLRIADAATSKIAISNFIKDSYCNCISNVEVVYDGLEIEAYLEKKEILRNDYIVASMYGNLDKQKGQLIAVKAMEILQKLGNNNFYLNIVGNQHTEYAKVVKNYVIEHGINNVQFIDSISDADELRAHRKLDDINLVCSSAEGLGRVTIESMLAGCLTIGASAGATVELLRQNETGLLFDNADYEQLAELLQAVIEHKELMRKIAYTGQQFAMTVFDIKKYTHLIQDKYYSIIAYKGENK